MVAIDEQTGLVKGAFVAQEAGKRRVVVLDSATHVPTHAQAQLPAPGTEVLVNASYAGVYCARLVNQAEPRGAIGVDCGIGKDGAGIAGLWFFEALGVPAAAADISTVELGNGHDLYAAGVVSRVNGLAQSVGLRPGMSVSDAADLLMAAEEIGDPDPYNRQVMTTGPAGRAVVATNSIADALPEDRDTNVLCTAGHTGRSVIDYIVNASPYGYICSDGGVGKNRSGLTALEPTSDAGIPGAAVSADSARMGDGVSTYEDGVISAANQLALELGVEAGMPAREAARLLIERESAS